MEFAGVEQFSFEALRALLQLLAAFESGGKLLRSGVSFADFVPKLIHLCLRVRHR